MIGRLQAVVLDTREPKRLAEFYAELLGLPITYADDGWVDIGDGTIQLSFQHAPDHQPPRWPDPAHPQQFHIDVAVEDVAEAERKVLALGATRSPADLARDQAGGERPPSDSGFRVYADPAGHPFCLCWG